MDAVEFIRERNRMCKAYADLNEGACGACSARYMECNDLCNMTGFTETDIVNAVEKWAAAHPRKTRQDLFLEQWPNAQLSRAGDIIICPKQLCKGEEFNKLMAGCRGTNCDVCRREFYGKVVE